MRVNIDYLKKEIEEYVVWFFRKNWKDLIKEFCLIFSFLFLALIAFWAITSLIKGEIVSSPEEIIRCILQATAITLISRYIYEIRKNGHKEDDPDNNYYTKMINDSGTN